MDKLNQLKDFFEQAPLEIAGYILITSLMIFLAWKLSNLIFKLLLFGAIFTSLAILFFFITGKTPPGSAEIDKVIQNYEKKIGDIKKEAVAKKKELSKLQKEALKKKEEFSKLKDIQEAAEKIQEKLKGNLKKIKEEN